MDFSSISSKVDDDVRRQVRFTSRWGQFHGRDDEALLPRLKTQSGGFAFVFMGAFLSALVGQSSPLASSAVVVMVTKPILEYMHWLRWVFYWLFRPIDRNLLVFIDFFFFSLSCFLVTSNLSSSRGRAVLLTGLISINDISAWGGSFSRNLIDCVTYAIIAAVVKQLLYTIDASAPRRG